MQDFVHQPYEYLYGGLLSQIIIVIVIPIIETLLSKCVKGLGLEFKDHATYYPKKCKVYPLSY